MKNMACASLGKVRDGEAVLCGQTVPSLSRGATGGPSWAGSAHELHAHVRRACPTHGLGLQTGRHWSRPAQQEGPPPPSGPWHGGEGGRSPSTALQELGKVFLYGLWEEGDGGTRYKHPQTRRAE